MEEENAVVCVTGKIQVKCNGGEKYWWITYNNGIKMQINCNCGVGGGGTVWCSRGRGTVQGRRQCGLSVPEREGTVCTVIQVTCMKVYSL
jgi:hypothetical protein